MFKHILSPPISSTTLSRHHLSSRVRVHLSLPTGHSDIHESPSVGDSLLCTSFGRFFLLLRLDLWCLRFYLACTRKRTMHFAHGDLLFLSSNRGLRFVEFLSGGEAVSVAAQDRDGEVDEVLFL